jgi:hypothetical protein
MSHLTSKKLFFTNSFTPFRCGVKNRKSYFDDDKLIVTSNIANPNLTSVTILQYLIEMLSFFFVFIRISYHISHLQASCYRNPFPDFYGFIQKGQHYHFKASFNLFNFVLEKVKIYVKFFLLHPNVAILSKVSYKSCKTSQEIT